MRAGAAFGLEDAVLVIVLAATAFGSLVVALVAARAADRLGASQRPAREVERRNAAAETPESLNA